MNQPSNYEKNRLTLKNHKTLNIKYVKKLSDL